MNHYLKNIAAKNLNQMEVIQPRLASRFEPAPQRILPAQRSLKSSVSKDGEPTISSDEYALDNHARVTARNLVRSRSALADQDPDSPGPETLLVTESGAVRLQSSQNRNIPPISEKKMPFSPSGQGEGDMQANFETARQTSPPPEEMVSSKSSISGSLGMASSPRTAPARKMVKKAIEKMGLEYRPSPQKPSPFDPIEEEKTSREWESGNELKLTERTSRGPRREKIVPLPIPEGKQVSLEQKPDPILKVVDRPASKIRQRKEKIVPIASIEADENKSGAEHSIKQKTGEPIVGTKPMTLSASPGMVTAQPYVKSYFRQEVNKILDKMAKPETTAPVQVTIGRIEIRATPASATPQRKRVDHPVMSLEDYLKIKRGSL